MAVALNQHLLCFSNSRTRPTTITPPCSCLLRETSLLSHKRKPFFSVISCSSSTSQSSEPNTQTAESCINLGLSLFSKGRVLSVRDALVQFETALTLDPTPVEAQAALYNKVCCHAYRLGAEDIGYSFCRDLKLISEVQAPFRGVRRFFYVALSAAAGISLFFTIPRLFRAINSGDGAPDPLETAGNAAINIGGIIVLVALFSWNNKKEEEQIAQITRDETLSSLPLRLSTNRIVELVQVWDTVRPGKRRLLPWLCKRQRFGTELLRQGVLLVPVICGEGREPEVQKKGIGTPAKAAAALPSIREDFDKQNQSVVAKSKLKAEIRFKAEVVSSAEWERWIRDQQKPGVTPGEDVYIIMCLDGRVRRSGKVSVINWND